MMKMVAFSPDVGCKQMWVCGPDVALKYRCGLCLGMCGLVIQLAALVPDVGF